MSLKKIGSKDGGHWCTEAVFQSFMGIESVEQGYVASTKGNSRFPEAVTVHFKTEAISLKTLIEIHLYTHKSTSNHSMQTKYRSVIYTFSEPQKNEGIVILSGFLSEFNNSIITKACPFPEFNPSRESIQNYYKKIRKNLLARGSLIRSYNWY